MSAVERHEKENHEHEENGHAKGHGNKYLALLALGALGVVYGDIGTSPLYAFRESFHSAYGLAVIPANVLGILSLIFWALTIVISIKYIAFVMRADNRGEGGILALTALIFPPGGPQRYNQRYLLILLGLFGTALLYGDGMITPAISVLSAVEGLQVATPFFQPYIVPITIVVLIVLFLFQSQGTERVGKVFGPLMLLWFVVLALLGLRWIVRQPGVLVAISPIYGIQFFLDNGWAGFLVLGSVFLVVTGGEALYADMGHFGKAPIRLAWFAVALPALLLNYFGQGALLLADPTAVENPFYNMTPEWALYPVVVLATIAAVIASQALITGAFSLTMQAVQLGYLPRVAIRHTSAHERGQIYIPAINWMLMVACVALVVAFGSSSNLAAAYGVAVTTTMVITTLLLLVVEREQWHWRAYAALGLTLLFLIVDVAFWTANLTKIGGGGWFPLVIGALVFTLMTTWKRGREILAQRLRAGTTPFAEFIERVEAEDPVRVPGTAVFMYSDAQATPPALLNNWRHNRVLHARVILLSVRMEERPRVLRAERVTVHDLGDGFYRVILAFGFMENPDVPQGLRMARHKGLELHAAEISYFLGRERFFATDHPGMAIWREKLFALMSRNSISATDFFSLPPNQVVELGTLVEL